MKIPFIIAIVLCLPPRSQGAEADSTATRLIDLPQAYAAALAKSEQIAISGETYQETMAKAEELWSHLLPQVTLMGTETLQHVPSGPTNQFLQPNREQGWVSVHQPLFSGLREFLAFRAAKDFGRSAELKLERAKQLLYQDVARAFLDLMSAQDAIRIRAALVAITKDRVNELKEFRRVGRSRASETLAAQSQLALNLAELESAQAAEKISQLQLGFLTGMTEPLRPAPLPAASAVPELESVLARARKRFDVEQRRHELNAAVLSQKVVSRQRWPTIGVDANYYFQRPPSFTSRVKWDATITGSLPLYRGGEIAAQSKQFQARRLAAELALAEAVRLAELESRTAHRQLLSSILITQGLEKAEKLAADNAAAQAEDYRLGQVTNLEVLSSLNSLQQTRLRLNEAKQNESWSRIRLGVAAGVIGGPL